MFAQIFYCASHLEKRLKDQMRILGNYLKSSTNSVEEQLKLKEKDGMKLRCEECGLVVILFLLAVELKDVNYLPI